MRRNPRPWRRCEGRVVSVSAHRKYPLPTVPVRHEDLGLIVSTLVVLVLLAFVAYCRLACADVSLVPFLPSRSASDATSRSSGPHHRFVSCFRSVSLSCSPQFSTTTPCSMRLNTRDVNST
jgi:hypothetical protein